MIRKILIILAFFIFSFSFAEEQEILSGGIKYNEATAKIEAFKDLPKKINKNAYREYLKDPNKKENISAIEKKQYLIEDRELCPFYFKEILVSYAVNYEDNPTMTFYYNIFGNLVRFDIIENYSDYQRTIGYSKYGNLINVSFAANTDEQFVYDKKGELIAHWVGEKMVDSKSRFIKITRKGIE